MIDLSQSSANTVFTLSNIMVVVGATLVLVGTIGSIWSGSVRERYTSELISNNAREAEAAKLGAAQANEHAAELRNEAEQARLEQMRLKQQLAWRRITADQHDAIVSALKDSGVLEVWVTFVGNDPESNVFREDIAETLQDAGITTHYFSGYAMAVGLKLKGPESSQKKRLFQAFTRAGVSLELSDDPGMGQGTKLELTVGSKPPPF